MPQWIWKTKKASPRADLAILKAIENSEGEFSDGSVYLSRSQLQRLIEEGKVTLDGKPIKTNTKVQEGVTLKIQFSEPRPTNLIPEDRPIDVLFEDEHLLVLNKPPGLTVHPSPTQMEGTLVHALLHHTQDLSGIGGVLRPGIVHRLDKHTSGALVITKNDLAHTRLSEVFAKHAIQRTYWALTYGACPIQKKVESLIGRDPNDRKKMSMKVKTGKKAITYIKKIEEYSKFEKKKKSIFASWLEITLETGRTHQIRVHLTGAGSSILGDPTYGKASLPEEIQAAVQKLPGQALHARVLGFKHPITGEALYFEANPPEDFNQLLKLLQKNSWISPSA
jgi:23S rRNA pseudouridine1911/1915/1917 synthase